MAETDHAPGDEGARPVAFPAQLRWRRRNPHARKAHLTVDRAKRRGLLEPQPCSWPGCREQRTEAHHENYDAPLDVTWLCRRHHRARHAQLKCEATSG